MARKTLAEMEGDGVKIGRESKIRGSIPRGLSGNLMVFGESTKTAKNRWCGEHEPGMRDTCKVHNARFEELHTDEMAREGIYAVFYCPVLGCDEFEWNTQSGAQWSLNCFNGRPIALRHVSVFEFVNWARNKILFHKLGQREGDGK